MAATILPLNASLNAKKSQSLATELLASQECAPVSEAVSERLDLMNFSREGMQTLFAELGEKSFRGDQLIKWIHQQRCLDFNAMTNLSVALRNKLDAVAQFKVPEIVTEKRSKDGTVKWLLRLRDGNCIETVFIPTDDRGTLCVSSQVGCTLNCSFCATGKQGFSRNLSVSEIIGQLWVARHRGSAVTNVVMMGMGEPLYNYDNVIKAMDLMCDDLAYGLSKYRVTLSTSGVIPEMKKLKAVSPVSLAVSLHAANDELRNVLVPLNKKYPLSELMAVCRDFYENEPKRKVTFEYVMLKGINDTKKHAKELITLLEGVPSKVNLIPFNPFQFTQYERSDEKTIDVFQNLLMAAGLNTIVRRTRGEDIDAACGQLAGNFKDKSTRKVRWLKKQERNHD